MYPVDKIPVIEGDIDSMNLSPSGKQLANALIMMNKIAVQVALSKVQVMIEKPDFKSRAEAFIAKREKDGQPLDAKAMHELEEGRYDVVTEKAENKTATIQLIYSRAMSNTEFKNLFDFAIREIVEISKKRTVNERATKSVLPIDNDYGN